MPDLTMVQGVPFSRQIHVVGGTAVWPTLASVEARAQVRRGEEVSSPLVVDLTPFLTVRIDSLDLVVDMSLTGAQTRAIPRSGFYDLILSDVGTVDARALKILSGKLHLETTVTAP